MARNNGVMSIDGFKAQIGDILRPNLFYLYITDGDSGNADGADFSSKTDLAFYAHSASIPSSTVAAVDVAFMGRSVRVAGNRTFADWNITVYSDIGSELREAFERWSGGINTHASNVGHNRIRRYMRTANIYQLDQMENIIATYELRDVWPNNVGEVQLAWSNNNQVESFQVTLTIGTYWVREVTKGGEMGPIHDGADKVDSLGTGTKWGQQQSISNDMGVSA